jgi:16S rRNA (adenine1518-N6/adenine1519-N6)-dimethyltransferase
MHKARKRFGQHFLKDEEVIEKLVAAIAPLSSEHILEIGPGLGALTFPLLKAHPELMAIEIDRDIVKLLNSKVAALKLFQADALNFDFSTLPSPLKIVGNLPYNISTPLLFHLLKYKSSIKQMYFMLQKEVVNRLAARPNTKDYGRLSVMIQLDFIVRPLFDVPPQAFSPPPEVDSAVVELIPKPSPPLVDKHLFADIVKEAFQYRRKTLRNALKKHFPIPGDFVDLTRRAETLSVEEYVKLANDLALYRKEH